MKKFDFKTKEDVLSFLEKKESEVKFVRIIFPDVLGREMSFCVPAEKMSSAFKNGAGFDGSSVEGFARVEESDLIIVPDPTTFRVLPWKYESQGVAWKEGVIFGDIYTSEGKHFGGDSRFVLKKVLEDNKGLGDLMVGPEMEFFIFENHHDPVLLDHGGYFYGGRLGEIRKLSQIYLREMGIDSECDHHEVAPSQHEINIKYKEALHMADSIMLIKYVIKRVARNMSFFASFMPKPITEVNGSGMHLHLSLWEEDNNLFFDAKKDHFLSSTAKKYLTGLIQYGRDIQLALNQWVNSYKRLIPGYEAPVYLAWGVKNRSAYVRVPQTNLKKAEVSTRIEIRSPDPACNIYLALALIHAAGAKGIKEKLKFPPPEEKDIFGMTEKEMEEKKIRTLADNLNEALGSFQGSELVKETLDPHLVSKVIQNKRIEWDDYQKATDKKFQKSVSPYEIQKYLPIL